MSRTKKHPIKSSNIKTPSATAKNKKHTILKGGEINSGNGSIDTNKFKLAPHMKTSLKDALPIGPPPTDCIIQ